MQIKVAIWQNKWNLSICSTVIYSHISKRFWIKKKNANFDTEFFCVILIFAVGNCADKFISTNCTLNQRLLIKMASRKSQKEKVNLILPFFYILLLKLVCNRIGIVKMSMGSRQTKNKLCYINDAMKINIFF